VVCGIIYYGIGGKSDKISKSNYFVRARYFNFCEFNKNMAILELWKSD
jgi:hypothetical protein